MSLEERAESLGGFSQQQIRWFIFGGVALVVALVVFIATWMIKIQQEEKATALYVKESTPSNWNQVVEQFPKTQIAAHALLQLASSHVEKMDYESALKDFQRFAAMYPQHPASPAVQLAIADCLHALGKTEQATPMYARLVQERGTFSIPAGVKLASIYDAQGKHANARELLQDILARPSDNEFYQEARILFERLAVAK